MQYKEVAINDSINKTEVLMIGSVDLNFHRNHRFIHIVRYFSSKCKHIDFVSYRNLYGGPPTSLLKKVTKSLHNLLFNRRRVYQEGNVRYIVIRKLKLPQFLQNLLGDLWIYLNLPKWLKAKHYDLCVYYDPYNTFLVYILKRSNTIDSIIYDDCDFFPDHLDAKGPISSLALSWKEHLAVTKADGVISVSEPLANLRRSQGAKKVLIAPNGVSLDKFRRARDKEPHPPTLIYIGLLSEAWGIDLILKAMPLIIREIPDLRFMIIGEGEHIDELERLTQQLGLENAVTFLGERPYDELYKHLRQADIGVATYKDRKFLEYASPLKIREYMAAGLPVVTSKIGQAKQMIRDSEAGELVENSPASISKAIMKILSDQKLYKKYSENAIRYAEKFDWTMILEKAFDFSVSKRL